MLPAYVSKILVNPIYRRKAVKRICDKHNFPVKSRETEYS
nr:MAG TPA: hypothetical protein [Caudoviricetes sp.]DAV44456.1 MAG TPA: hypothetical protein [Caudoviricetes sp.]